MRKFCIPTKFLRLTKLTPTNVRGQIKAPRSLWRQFNISNGLRPKDVLFNLALEKVIRDADVNARGTILFKSTQLLAFVEDVDIMRRIARGEQSTFCQIEQVSRDLGLHINEGKAKYMVVASAPKPKELTSALVKRKQ